jgi:diguanylate cyclase (GGDEF)-like protein/PAS domain S-box-containing protein
MAGTNLAELDRGRRRRLLARCGAVLFVGAGVLTLLTEFVDAPGLHRAGTATVGILAVVAGIAVWLAPWERWPDWASLVLVPPALALIAVGNVLGPRTAYDYGVYFMVVHVWIGLAHRPRTSLFVAPLTTLAYALPLAFIAADPMSAVASGIVVVPLCALVGEAVSWVTRQLDATEVNRRVLEDALEREHEVHARLKDVHARLESSEHRYRALVEQMPAITYVDAVDEQSTTLYISPQIEPLIGYHPAEWMADPALWSRLLHPDDREEAMRLHRRSNETREPFRAEYRMIARDGSCVWVRDEATCVDDPWGRIWQGVLVDITARKRAELDLEFLAYHDRVTGLPNRAFFEQHLDLALARARRSGETVAVCSVDLDKFKLVNDTLGHAAGDDFLREVAGRLHHALREGDVVARVGGDEFLVLMPFLAQAAGGSAVEHGGGNEGAAAMLRDTLSTRLAAALELPFVLSDMEFHMSASTGVGLYPFDGGDGHALMKQADAAMYRNKRERSGFASVDGRNAGTGDLSLASRLRRAAREGAWELHYQPIIELVTGATVGAEALLRWNDPVHGSVQPNVFIPLAEELGLISTVGGWVVDELTRQCTLWREEGLLDRLSCVTFNVSPRELWHPALAARLDGLVAAVGRPDVLVLEITESALGMDPERAQAVLQDIRRRGVRIALDDFGTGFSSLARLRSLPIDVVKIDRDFVQDIEADPSARSVLRSVIRLALSLGMVPLAEGVETPEQLEYVMQEGCPLVQGHLFRPAIAPEEFTRWLRADAASRHEVEVYEPLASAKSV